MKNIVYVSQAVKPFDTDELAMLLEHSQARNLEDGITGLLIYRYNSEFTRGNFVQCLEGSDAAIENVWKRISNDSRHHTIVVVEEGPIESRAFSEWSMGFRNVSSEDLKHIDGFSDLGSDDFWEKALSGESGESGESGAAGSGGSELPALELLKSFYDGI